VTGGAPLSGAAAACAVSSGLFSIVPVSSDPARSETVHQAKATGSRPAGRRQESYSWRPLPAGRWPGNDDQINVHAHQFGSQVREPFRLALA